MPTAQLSAPSSQKIQPLPTVNTTMRVDSSLLQESLGNGDLLCCWRDVEPFPVVLHRLLGNMPMERNEHIISWNRDGKSFTIYEPKVFADQILTRYFKNQTRYKSFQRQLNLYRFNRISPAKEKGVYAHNSFMRDFPHLCQFVRRTRKQTREAMLGKQEALRDSPDSHALYRPTALSSEINLTYSATSDVSSAGNSRTMESIEIKPLSTPIVRCTSGEDDLKDKECPSAEVVVSTESSSSWTPMKDIDRSATTALDYRFSKTTDHVHALLATLTPPTGSSCTSDSEDHDDNLSIGSIEDYVTTMTSGAMLDLSWACRPADIEIFP